MMKRRFWTVFSRSLRNMRGQWEMVFAEGGAAALLECASRPFDVVVSDARMPGMEGAEFLGKVEESLSRLRSNDPLRPMQPKLGAQVRGSGAPVPK